MNTPRDEWLETIRASGYVTARDLPDGGIAIDADPVKMPGASPIMTGVLLFVICGLFGLAALYLSSRWLNALSPRQKVKLWMLCGLAVMGVLMVGLIRLNAGPAKPAHIEARPGLLRAQRTLSGDRVDATYTTDQFDHLFVEIGILWIATRKGQLQLIPFGRHDAAMAIASLLAAHLSPTGEFTMMATNIGGVPRWLYVPTPSSIPSGPLA